MQRKKKWRKKARRDRLDSWDFVVGQYLCVWEKSTFAAFCACRRLRAAFVTCVASMNVVKRKTPSENETLLLRYIQERVKAKESKTNGVLTWNRESGATESICKIFSLTHSLIHSFRERTEGFCICEQSPCLWQRCSQSLSNVYRSLDDNRTPLPAITRMVRNDLVEPERWKHIDPCQRCSLLLSPSMKRNLYHPVPQVGTNTTQENEDGFYIWTRACRMLSLTACSDFHRKTDLYFSQPAISLLP